MQKINKLVNLLKAHVIEKCSNPYFIHHQWYAEYHLEIASNLAIELCNKYKSINRIVVLVAIWLHDYSKIIDSTDKEQLSLIKERELLEALGFNLSIINSVLLCIELSNKHNEINLRDAPLDVQIVSSADGASHFIGPFHYLWWLEHPEKNYKELMKDNARKAQEDWERKIVLSCVRECFHKRYLFVLEQCGMFEKDFLDCSEEIE